MLGAGFQEASIQRAMSLNIDMMGCDAGTCDGGPSYLATGKAAFSAAAVGRDLDLMLAYAVPANVPVIVGSAGMSGCDQGVDWVVSMVKDIARRRGLRFRLARIYSELDRETVKALVRGGRASALSPSATLTQDDVDATARMVGVMGVEPLQSALENGADVIIAGRCTDAAIFAALPILRGYDAAAAWHMAKILECGAAAVEQRSAADSMLGTLRADGFEIEPLRPDYRCTPQSVASHALYETADPFVLHEPSGTLLLEDATYEAVSDRAVCVRKSRFKPAATYTNKIEGVRQVGYSTVVFAGVRDPYILAEMDGWLAGIERVLKERIVHASGAAGFELKTRVYGKDAVMGAMEPVRGIGGHEVGILWEVIAATQDLATSVAHSLTHLALHYPISKWSGLITGLALPFSPAHINRGPVYEFNLNHVLASPDPHALFRTKVEDV